MLPVVIVDDVEEDMLLAERVFRQCKILNPIELIRSGRECLNYFEGKGKYSDRVLPVFLLLDLMMPPFHGTDVLRRLQGGDLLKESVVVMLSGLTDVKSINEGYQMGARTFLVKPITVDDVVQTISYLKGIRIEQRPDGYILHLDREQHMLGARGEKRGGFGETRISI